MPGAPRSSRTEPTAAPESNAAPRAEPGTRGSLASAGPLPSTVPLEVGVYVHVAFCQTKCFYCDFNTYAGLGHLIDRYVEALVAEVGRLPPTLPGVSTASAAPLRVGSIFFGGGTPSLLSVSQIAAVLAAIRRWPLASGAEVTLEANPDDPTADYLRQLRQSGVNRISLGVQSFDDAMLRRLGRRHDAAAARRAFDRARAAGFDNVSIDLMFGLPGQTLAHWEATLEQALILQPDHLSLYHLTIEPETPYATWIAAGRLTVPDDDAAADMYEAAIDRLGAAGYDHYEISNWARRNAGRDYRGQHNLRYWRNQPYLGVGAGAHSSFADHRYATIRAPRAYVARALAGASTVDPDTVEAIGPALAMGETMLLGLRLAEGIDVATFRARFGRSPRDVYPTILDELVGAGLLLVEPDRIRLTPRGRFLGNEVFWRFLPTD